nr:hypothetical protein [Tanacetum cinerariifolium]
MWSDQEKRIQKIDHLARSLLIQGLPNDIYSLIDSNKTAKDLWDALARHMLGSEYGEQHRKAAILYEYETFKATEGELLLDAYIRYLQVISDLKKCGYSKDNCELNFKFLNNLQPEWKQYATMMRQNKNLMDINIDALYNILKQNQRDVNDAMGSKKKTVVVTSDPLALIVEKTNMSRSKEKSANKKQKFVKTDTKKVEKKDEEKKRDMSRVKCYNCKKEGHFAKYCKKAKVEDYEYYKTNMLLAKKDKDEQVLLAADQAWMVISVKIQTKTAKNVSKVQYNFEMSRDVLTVGSIMRIPLLYQGEYSQWVERFMNYLKEQTDREAMINSIKNGDQPLPRVTQVSIAGTTSTEQPPLKDKSMCNKTAKDLCDALARHMLGSEYGEQDRKAAVLSKEKVVVSLDFEGSEADDFNQEINENIVFMAQIDKVLSDSEASSSSTDEKICELKELIEKNNDLLAQMKLDTFYNALNPADQDSLNNAAGGNLLEKSPQDALTIIENKSKVRNSRSKPISSPVNAYDINSSSEIAKLTHAVKAVEEICVTCGGAHPYYQCLAAGGNTFPEFRDNIQGYVSAAVGNYNQGNPGYRPQGVANQMRPSGEDSNFKDSIDQTDLANLNDLFVDPTPEMFTNEHAPDYSFPPRFDVYPDDFLEIESDANNFDDDFFDSKGEKIKEFELLIDQLDLPCDILSEYDSFNSQDFSRDDDLPSPDNEDKVFNPGILIHEKSVIIITRVTQENKLAIYYASLVFEDFDPPFYEPLVFKAVPNSMRLLLFSFENEEKVFKPVIYTSDK